jgi:hypothetical protein
MLMVRITTKAKKAARTSPATAPGKPPTGTHEMVLSPTIQSAAGVHAWSKFIGEPDLGDLILDLRQQVKKVQGGDMEMVEAMLYGQAMTLQTIFTNLARKAVAQEYLKQLQVNLTLALKAQAQCRVTLEALAEIKNPRQVAFVKQANISGGPQQVNNATQQIDGAVAAKTGDARAGAHAGQIAGEQNELLEGPHGNALDVRTPSTAGRADPNLEAVAAGHRAAYP